MNPWQRPRYDTFSNEITFKKDEVSVKCLTIDPVIFPNLPMLELTHTLSPCFFISTRKKRIRSDTEIALVYKGSEGNDCDRHEHRNMNVFFTYDEENKRVAVSIKLEGQAEEIPYENRLRWMPHELHFPDGKITTQVLKVQSSSFQQQLEKIKLEQNLPECFITDAPEEYIMFGQKIHITFKGTKGDWDGEDARFTMKQYFSVTTEIKITEDRDPIFDPLRCPGCSSQYTVEGTREPKFLSTCGHTICSECSTARRVVCPIDRKVQRNPLQKNLIVEEMLKNPKQFERKMVIEDLPGEASDPVIVPCCEDNKHESTCYCKDCRADFCHNCFVKVHTQSSILSKHKLVPIYKKPIVLPFCDRHPRQTARFICKSAGCTRRGQLFCISCASEGHLHETNGNVHHVCLKNYAKLYEEKLRTEAFIYRYRELSSILLKQKESFQAELNQHKGQLKTETASINTDAHARDIMQQFQNSLVEIAVSEADIKRIHTKLYQTVKKKENLHDIEAHMRPLMNLLEAQVGDGVMNIPFPYNFPANCHDNGRAPAARQDECPHATAKIVLHGLRERRMF